MSFSVEMMEKQLEELRKQIGAVIPGQAQTTDIILGDSLPDTLVRVAMLLAQAESKAGDMETMYDWGSVDIGSEDNLDDVLSDDLHDLSGWIECAIDQLICHQREAEVVTETLKMLDTMHVALTQYREEHGLM
ncbi:MAG: hypothetical protein LIP11_04050 [Clostridiales bacterium]|nr:hypothetical protein [Clostridiales bacterium]